MSYSGPNLANYYNRLHDTPLLYKYQFVVSFKTTSDDGIEGINEDTSYFVQSASIPTVSLSTGTVTYFGKDFKVPGVKQFEHNWQCKFILLENWKLYEALRSWQRKQSSLANNTGGIRKLPNVDIKIDILKEDSQNISNTIILKGVWLKSLQDINLAYKDGGGDAQTGFTVDFRYQYSYMIDEAGNGVDGRIKLHDNDTYNGN